MIQNLSTRLRARYGKGFATQSLWNFRQFHLTYADRLSILSPTGRESPVREILYPPGRESSSSEIIHLMGGELAADEKSSPSGSFSARGFSPILGWSHYRALMRVQEKDAREFYEREAAECGWSKAQLERQIQSASSSSASC